MTSRPRRKEFNRHNLWPWRWWMTVGIGVLATSSEGRAKNICPDHIVLFSDTMGSFGNEFSHPRLHKRFDLPKEGFYAIAANQVDRAAELMPVISEFLSKTPRNERNYGAIFNAVNSACFAYKRMKFVQSVLPKHRIEPDLIDPFRAASDAALIPGKQAVSKVLEEEWKEFDIGCDLLIAAFDCRGQAMLLTVSGADGITENATVPGFAAIGSGLSNAMFWLSHRKQFLGMKLMRSVYHAYEAKTMAESSPNVNDELDVLIANAGQFWKFSSHFKPGPHAHPFITIEKLKELFLKYGPQGTEEIDDLQRSLWELKKESVTADAKSAGEG